MILEKQLLQPINLGRVMVPFSAWIPAFNSKKDYSQVENIQDIFVSLPRTGLVLERPDQSGDVWSCRTATHLVKTKHSVSSERLYLILTVKHGGGGVMI